MDMETRTPPPPWLPENTRRQDNQGLRMGRWRGEGGLGDREAEKTGDAGTPPPCSCPLALGPRHPPPTLPCSVCVTTPDTGLGAVRPDCQWTDSEFHCLFCTALKLFSTLDREGKPPQSRE